MEKENISFWRKMRKIYFCLEGKGGEYLEKETIFLWRRGKTEKEIAFWPRRRRGASCEPRWLPLYSETKEAYKYVILSTQSEH